MSLNPAVQLSINFVGVTGQTFDVSFMPFFKGDKGDQGVPGQLDPVSLTQIASAVATAGGAAALASQVSARQANPDWNATDTTSLAFIQNKPFVPEAAGDLGLGNVDNTRDIDKPVSAAAQAALNLKLDASQKGVVNGVASLDATGKVPATLLPSYVDDVLEFSNLAGFPVTGETGKIYTALDTNKIYRWSGTVYIEISASPGTTDAVAEGVSNLYFTTPRAAAAAPVQTVAGRAGAVVLTKGDVGLGNVDNTSDVNKPVSTAQQAALDAKQATLVAGTSIKTIAGASPLGSGNIAPILVLAQSAVAVPLTGVTTETTLASITVPANTVGINGSLRITTLWSYTNGSNAKNLRVYLGGVLFLGQAPTTTNASQWQTIIRNRGSLTSQIGFGPQGGSPYGATSTTNATASLNMAIQQTIAITGQLASASDTLTLEGYTVEVLNP